MESPIILSSATEDNLNQQIDDMLRQRYLLKGAMQKDDDAFSQEMIFPNNIDSELTLRGGIQLVVGIIVYITIMCFIF